MCASKMLPRSMVAVAVAALLALSPISDSHAANKKPDPNKEQIRRLQQVQKRLEQEKATIAGELDAEKKKVEEEAQRAVALEEEAGALRAARDQTKSKLAATEAKLKETQAELTRTKEQQLEQQRQAEAEKKRLQQDLAAGKQKFDACVQRDEELRKVSTTVLELYEKKTCADGWWQSEPFTGLKRVEIENTVEDLREKLEAPAAAS